MGFSGGWDMAFGKSGAFASGAVRVSLAVMKYILKSPIADGLSGATGAISSVVGRGLVGGASRDAACLLIYFNTTSIVYNLSGECAGRARV